MMRLNLQVYRTSTIGYATQTLQPTRLPYAIILNRKMKMEKVLQRNNLQFVFNLHMVI
jgi:hypothetical protein